MSPWFVWWLNLCAVVRSGVHGVVIFVGVAMLTSRSEPFFPTGYSGDVTGDVRVYRTVQHDPAWLRWEFREGPEVGSWIGEDRPWPAACAVALDLPFYPSLDEALSRRGMIVPPNQGYGGPMDVSRHDALGGPVVGGPKRPRFVIPGGRKRPSGPRGPGGAITPGGGGGGFGLGSPLTPGYAGSGGQAPAGRRGPVTGPRSPWGGVSPGPADDQRCPEGWCLPGWSSGPARERPGWFGDVLRRLTRFFGRGSVSFPPVGFGSAGVSQYGGGGR